MRRVRPVARVHKKWETICDLVGPAGRTIDPREQKWSFKIIIGLLTCFGTRATPLPGSLDQRDE